MNQTEEYLNRIPMWADRKNTLEDVRRYLEELGDPDGSMRILHVAGTNGKGSVCAYLTSMLREAGHTTATFVSPHLESVRERFLINGELVSEEDFENAFGRVKSLSDRMTERGFQPPTYFEFLFYMFLCICLRTAPDFVILETGLGGRLDVTNVIRRPVLTVLTSISLDHMQYLGDTVGKIAGEKAGIIKPGVPVVYDASCGEAARVIEARARELGCALYPTDENSFRLLGRSGRGTDVAVSTVDGGQVVISVPSRAEYQMMNAALAVRAAGVLRSYGICWFSPGDVIRGIRCAAWPGRMEEILPGVFLDGAHNMGGIREIARTMSRMQKESGRPISLLFGVMSDKEYDGMIRYLCRKVRFRRVIVTTLPEERAAAAGELAETFRRETECPVLVFDEPGKALDELLKNLEGDMAFCVGSLHLVGELRGRIRKENGNDKF